jgi:hypothetical protein
METGSITMQGTGKELLSNDDVKKAYLGQDPNGNKAPEVTHQELLLIL